ncbi:MAG TPA: hypothetical protein VM282_19575 [Acidimicrobiales bacterium]|nr:hypothetical protein [Acidimicrobiales bacterium]
MSMTESVWQYEHSLDVSTGFVGYDVEATDGSIGKIDSASAEAGRTYVVVDTGIGTVHQKRLIPAGYVRRVDHDNERVHVAMTKEQIRDAE